MLIAVFQCGRDDDGAEDRCGAPTGAIPVEVPPRVEVEGELVPKPVAVPVVETGGAVATTTGREVRSIVFAT
jgi:hypothetical protein